MNDAIENSQYTTQPAANVKLVSNGYTPKAFDEAALPEAGSGSVSTDIFKDIAGHWGKSYIEKMNKAGIINGYEDGTFRPDGTVTKGEFATLIVNALKIDTTKAEGHWATEFVNAAKAANLIADEIAVATAADLDTKITREEMASMVSKAAAYKKVAITDIQPVVMSDFESIAEWAQDDVNNAVILGIISGFEDGTFRPKETATRAQAATMLSMLYELF